MLLRLNACARPRGAIVVAVAAALTALAVIAGGGAVRLESATADHLMCGWRVEPRPQRVSIDPDLSTAGVSYADVLAAFDAWNRLFERYHGFPIFVPHAGDWLDADILISAHGWSRTWVHGLCFSGYVQRGHNHSVVFLGREDAWRNRELLAHELGHALGFADHGTEAGHTDGHIGYKPCGTYVGVMSYCAGPQTWFLDYDAGRGITLDGQLVRDYWQP